MKTLVLLIPIASNQKMNFDPTLWNTLPLPNNEHLIRFLPFSAFQEWLRSVGITHYTTQTYSPEMNGIAENAIKHIVSRASAMLADAGIPVGFWPEAVRCATYFKNRSPHRSLTPSSSRPHGMTPFEAYNGVKPNLSHLRIFGCRCYAHLEKEGT